MPFQSLAVSLGPRVSIPIGLSVNHIDPKTLTVSFHYQEKQESDGVWLTIEHADDLIEGVHFSMDARNGTVTLTDHPFWGQMSTWRAGGPHGRFEPLLYKGQVKHPQYVKAEFEYYAPKAVKPGSRADLSRKNASAKKRLGYDVPEYGVEL